MAINDIAALSHHSLLSPEARAFILSTVMGDSGFIRLILCMCGALPRKACLNKMREMVKRH